MKFLNLSTHLLTCCLILSGLSVRAGEVSGNLKKWDHVTIEFTGPMTSETATPNPFRDYRLNVTFTGPSGRGYVVAGFYAADGDAANTSATSGDKWHVIFNPDEAGTWSYSASFREGTWVSISPDPDAGAPTFFDGDSGTFTVADLDGSEQGFYAKGKLRYVGKHHMQFAETGEYYLKSGTDGPENFWGYPGFDNTDNPASNFSTFAGHADEWNEGDPTWGDGRGKEIIGAINYLESVNVNGIYTMIFNAALNNGIGDHGAAFPWLEPASDTNDITRYDVSKLAQWNVVLNHCDLKGIQWQCMFAEHENQSFFEWRDNPNHSSDDYAFADTRKLYFREIIARLGSHHAIVYNLAEETQWPGTGHEAVMTDQAIRDYWQYLRDLDPYNHPRTTHSTSGTATNFYPSFYGDPNMECTSIQGDLGFYDSTIELREGSSAAGRPIAIYWDEQSPGAIDNVDVVRREIYWPQLMAGGAGAQWYLAGHDASLTNYETDLGGHFDRLFRMTGITRIFVQENMPFYDAFPRQDLINTGYCLAVEEEAYLIYLPNGGTADLDLSGNSKEYTLQWFDPRNGGQLQNGNVTSLTGGAVRNIGTPPSSHNEDWACLIKVASVTAGLSASKTAICDSEEVIFTSNSVNTANFGGRGFDNVYLANRSGANDENETGSFAQYIANYPALVNEDANPEADPDGDGISNQLEQWFASDPTVPNTGNAPVQGSSDGQTFHFEFTFDATVTSTQLVYETSPDLENWTPHALDPSWITEDGDLRRVRTSFKVEQGQQFHRLRVAPLAE